MVDQWSWVSEANAKKLGISVLSLQDSGNFRFLLNHCHVIKRNVAITSSHFEGRKAFLVAQASALGMGSLPCQKANTLCARRVAAGEGSRPGDGGQKVWGEIWVGEGPQERTETPLGLKGAEGWSQRRGVPRGKEEEAGREGGTWIVGFFLVVNGLQTPLSSHVGNLLRFSSFPFCKYAS